MYTCCKCYLPLKLSCMWVQLAIVCFKSSHEPRKKWRTKRGAWTILSPCRELTVNRGLCMCAVTSSGIEKMKDKVDLACGTMLGYLGQVICSCYLDQKSAHTDIIHFMWFLWCNMHSTMVTLHISIITPGPQEKWGQRLVYWPLKDLQKLFNSTAKVQLSDCLLMWCISSRVPLNRQRGRSKVSLHRVVTQIKPLAVTWGSIWLLMFTASVALRGGVVVLFGVWCVEVGRRALSSYSWSPLQNAWSGIGVFDRCEHCVIPCYELK